jgi:membrane peptidoglycan carboxypeptidase
MPDENNRPTPETPDEGRPLPSPEERSEQVSRFYEPPRSADDTDEMEFVDEDVPFKLPDLSKSQPSLGQEWSKGPSAQVTEPRVPQVNDPRQTLPGSGGLDPNPEMGNFHSQETMTQPKVDSSQATMNNPRVNPGGQATMPNMPSVTTPNSAATVQNIRAVPQNPNSGYTIPNPAAGDRGSNQGGQNNQTIASPIPNPQSPNQGHGPQTIQSQPPVPQGLSPADEARYRRPVSQGGIQPSGHGQYVPPPPNAGQKALPRRRSRTRVLGLPAGCVWAALGLIVTFCGGFTLISGVLAAVFIPRIEAQWGSQLSKVDTYQSFQSSFYYDRNGNELYESFDEGRRTIVTYDRFPQDLIDATIAIEDDSFWDNIGVDVGATSVALLKYVGAGSGERTAGGSTITQQVVRNILFSYEKRNEISASRKAEEIILAILLTNRRSKQDILAMYLNEIYYGNLAYGAQMAAQTLFGKDVKDLTLGESALLAGLPQSPASLDPLNPDPEVQESVYERQRLVLSLMREEGYITQAEMDAALAQGLTFVTPSVSLKAPHFTVYAKSELERVMTELGYTPEDIARGGLRVYTTIDQEINALAQTAAANQVAGLARQNVTNAAVVVIKPLTGEILGMVGSIDYNSETIDGRVNVTIALRQPGSTMKPFTYAAAMERGMNPAEVLWDTKTDIGIPGQPAYTPHNYDGRFHGPVIMRTALANSYNIPAVQTLRLVGVDYLLLFMERLGITTFNQDASQYGLSLTLGGGEISLLELTNAYAVFANAGNYVPTTSIRCILNSNNEIIYQYENGCPAGDWRVTERTVDRSSIGRLALDPRIAFIISDVLGDNVARTPAMGSSSPLRTDGIGSSVKTGTTNDYKDNWTVGYTRNVAIGVWAGNNDNSAMINSSGLTGAAPIWNEIIRGIYGSPSAMSSLAIDGSLMPDGPDNPGGMSQQRACDVRRLTDPSPNCPAEITEWMLDGPPGVPDEAGNLTYAETALMASPGGQMIEQVSPGVYRALVFPIAPEIANGLQFTLNPGDKQPPPPKYCRVGDALASTPGTQALVFIAPPITSQGDAVEAENYARSANLAVLPAIDCSSEIMVAGGGGQYGPAQAVVQITSPGNGETVSDNVPIMGTVQFDSSIAEFYQFYIQGGPFADYTPLGNQGFNSVVNGQLETLAAAGLPAGQYRLRLVLVKAGNFIQAPAEITFTRP